MRRPINTRAPRVQPTPMPTAAPVESEELELATGLGVLDAAAPAEVGLLVEPWPVFCWEDVDVELLWLER